MALVVEEFMDSSIVRKSAGLLRARERAQGVVEYVLAASAILVTGSVALAAYSGALQAAFTRLIGHVNGIT